MSRQTALKYVLPIAAVAVLLLLAAWAFRLPPVSALTERGGPSVAVPSHPVEQVAGYGYDTISVSGTGTVTAKPDLAVLSLGVSVTADTVAEARTQAATSMQAVLDALAASGVAENDIQTTHFSIYQDWDWVDGDQVLDGYEVSNEISAKVRDVDTVGTVIDAAVVAGGNDIWFHSLDYGFSNATALEQQARRAAVADMKSKAAQLAQFSNRRLGDLMVISEGSIPPEVFGAFREVAALAAADATPIIVGEESVTVTVSGVYELR